MLDEPLRRGTLSGLAIIAQLAAVALPEPAWSQTAEPFGHVGVELRAFSSRPLDPRQPDLASFSLELEPGLSLALGRGATARAIALVRLDQSDPRRSYFDPREALLQYGRGSFTATLGINTVFWGVTESRHLVDIVNQSDYLEDIDGEEKFGQLMGLVTYDGGELGVFDIFVMSWFRPQLYPGREGRPGVPFPIRDDARSFESSWEEWNLDGAVRWWNSRGSFDWALSYFRGTGREPELMPIAGEGDARRPHYGLIHQGGLEFQWTRGPWLWKAEGIVRAGQGPLFLASTVGFERTTTGVFGSDADLGLLLEYSYDGRDNLTYNIYDDDLFGGVRLSLNDIQGSEILAGALLDVRSGVTLATVEASRRLGERWSMELIGRLVVADDETDPLYWFRRDDHVRVVVEYHW